MVDFLQPNQIHHYPQKHQQTLTPSAEIFVLSLFDLRLQVVHFSPSNHQDILHPNHDIVL